MSLPAIQFYPADWLRDPQLRMASSACRGIWIDLLCHMWNAPKRGEVAGTLDQLRRLACCTEAEFSLFLNEIETLKFGDLSRDSHGLVRIVNRRMVRDEKARKDAAIRQRRHRQGTASLTRHVDVTQPVTALSLESHNGSSSSSSSSSSKRAEKRARPGGSKPRKPETPLPDDWQLTPELRRYATEHGREPELEAERFKKHACSNDVRHRNWDAAFQRWCLSDFGRANSKGRTAAPVMPTAEEYFSRQ